MSPRAKQFKDVTLAAFVGVVIPLIGYVVYDTNDKAERRANDYAQQGAINRLEDKVGIRRTEWQRLTTISDSIKVQYARQ